MSPTADAMSLPPPLLQRREEARARRRLLNAGAALTSPPLEWTRVLRDVLRGLPCELRAYLDLGLLEADFDAQGESLIATLTLPGTRPIKCWYEVCADRLVWLPWPLLVSEDGPGQAWYGVSWHDDGLLGAHDLGDALLLAEVRPGETEPAPF